MNTNVSDMEKVVRQVLFRNVELSKRVSSLEAKNTTLEVENVRLDTENRALRERLSRLERPAKDNHNSSIPSGRESLKAQAVRRTCSLCTPSGRPPGGQTGHKGTTLLMSATPDDDKNTYSGILHTLW